MDYFYGDYKELQAHVLMTGVLGDWKDISDNQKQYRTENSVTMNWWISTKKLQFQGGDNTYIKSFKDAINVQVNRSEVSKNEQTKKQIFIVHGHDDESLKDIELFIRRLGLEPYILKNNSANGNTIIEALEESILVKSAFGIVLMTPDDIGCSKKDYSKTSENFKPRVRQNVVLEMGILIGALGRTKVLMLVKGNLECPSDVHGIVYIQFNDSIIKDAGGKIIERLKNAGIKIDYDKITSALS